MQDQQADDKIVYGACQHDCPDNCAMETSVRDGRVISVKGRHDHPFTHGVLCAKVKSLEKRVYAADRILHPLRSVGAKGSAEFERISWDEALDEIPPAPITSTSSTSGCNPMMRNRWGSPTPMKHGSPTAVSAAQHGRPRNPQVRAAPPPRD